MDGMLKDRPPGGLLARLVAGEAVAVTVSELAAIRALDAPAASLVRETGIARMGWLVVAIRPPSVTLGETLDRIKRNGGG